MKLNAVHVAQQNSYLREVRESQKVFSALVNEMEKSHKALVAAIEERQSQEEKRVETLVEELKQEIQVLRKESPDPEPQTAVNDDQSEDVKQVTVVIHFSRHNNTKDDVKDAESLTRHAFFTSCRTLCPICALLR